MNASASGLLVLNKPSGITSFDCVSRVRRLSHIERVGHTGTLDPLATGVLLVLVGSTTERQEEFMQLDKQYRLKARFGVSTDSGDQDGSRLHTYPDISLSRETLARTLTAFVGDQWQIPPRYAALKFQGKHYYDWSRAGVEIPRAPRSIDVRAFELLSYEWPIWEARVVCSRGTYVRTLVEDVAQHLGTGAMLEQLERERIGPYPVGDALSWTELNGCRDLLGHHARHV